MDLMESMREGRHRIEDGNRFFKGFILEDKSILLNRTSYFNVTRDDERVIE